MEMQIGTFEFDNKTTLKEALKKIETQNILAITDIQLEKDKVFFTVIIKKIKGDAIQNGKRKQKNKDK